MPFLSLSYSGGYSNNEVGYGSPYGYSASVTPQQTMQYDISADYVDSTTYEPRSTIIDPEFISHGKLGESPIWKINDKSLNTHINLYLSSGWRYKRCADQDAGGGACQHKYQTGSCARHVPKAAGECLSLKPESIPLIMEHIFLAVQDVSRILYYKNLGQEELWLDCAEKLTQMIQNIIEFAKLIPGFMRLSQDDQVSFLCDYAIKYLKIVNKLPVFT